MYRPSRVILTGWVLIPIAPKHDAHLCSLPISLFLSLTASKSPSFTRQANATKSSRKSSESITPRFLSLSSIRSILPSTEFFHPSLHSPVKSTFSITFVFIYYYFIELHHHPCTGECRKKYIAPSSTHFHSGSPSLSLSREKPSIAQFRRI